MATRDYTLGKGKVLFKPTGSASFIDLGNAPAFAINVNIEKLEHFSSRAGLSVKDLEVITRLGMGGSFTLDEPNAENLRMFTMASTTDAQAQVAAALAAIDDVVLPAADALGKWYTLGKSSGSTKSNGLATANSQNTGTATAPLVSGTQTANATHTYTLQVAVTAPAASIEDIDVRYSVDGAPFGSAVALSATGGLTLGATGLTVDFDQTEFANFVVGDEWSFTVTYTPTGTVRVYNIDTTTVLTDSVTVTVGATQMVEGIEGVGNYQVDRKAGLIYINLDQTTPSNAIADGDTLDIQVKLLDGSKSVNQGGTLMALKGDLYFVGNPPQGRIIDIMGYCSLTPNGDFALIGTDWMQVQFNVEFLEQAGVSGLIKVEDRGKVDA